MIKNYFSDITDLFLKVKNEENIRIDETAKAEIRSLLVSKIATMKSPDTSETENAKPSFWSTWKYQLFGVPASVFALVLITFAASNLKISMPKEDFSPINTQPEKNAVVESITEKEKDRPLVKTAQKLVIDYGEQPREERSLNRISTVEEEPVKVTPEIKIPETEYSNNQILVLNEPEEKQEETVKTEVEPEKIAIIATTATKTPSLEEDIPLDEPEKIAEPVAEPVIVAVSNTDPILTTTQVAAPVTSLTTEKSDYPVYVYKDEELKTQPAFTEEKLAKLTRSKTPESITVYYVEDKHVVVEIEENEVTKWYLFDNIEGEWTLSKYEKFITEDVVK